MRTLVLSIDPVFPSISGADLRNHMHVMAACRLGPVLSVSLYPGAAEPDGFGVASLGNRPREQYWKGRQGRLDVTAGEAGRLSELVRSFRPDVVLVEGALLHDLAISHSGSVRLVVDMHNIESELHRAQGRAEPWTHPFRRWRNIVRAGAFATAELALTKAASAVWVCSEADRLRLGAATGFFDARVVPNAVPQSALPLAAHPRDPLIRPNLVFIGHLTYRPNVWAAIEIASKVLPALRRHRPDATLTFAGRSPSRRVRRLVAPGVRLIADPPEIGPILSEADFAVIPLRTGGGTRIKILEAMAAGLIVVATMVAAEGLDLVPGEHFLLAETAEEMARAVATMIAEPERAVRMRAAARQAVLARYAPEAVAERGMAELRAVAEA